MTKIWRETCWSLYFNSSFVKSFLWIVQVWCILKDSGDADVMDRTNTASRPLTVCTYPEVWTSVVLASSVITFFKTHLTRKHFMPIFIFICLFPPSLRSSFWAAWSPWWLVPSSCVWTLCWSWRCCCWRWPSTPTSSTWPSSRSHAKMRCTGQGQPLAVVLSSQHSAQGRMLFFSVFSVFFFFFTCWDFSWLCRLCWASLQAGSQFTSIWSQNVKSELTSLLYAQHKDVHDRHIMMTSWCFTQIER